MKTSEKLAQAKDFLRHPVCFPGGYSKRLYFTDGETICHKCALENWADIVAGTLHPEQGDPSWGVLTVDVHWEGPDEHCCQCFEALPSEYGDPDYDPTPWCTHCKAETAADCDCGPIADND